MTLYQELEMSEHGVSFEVRRKIGLVVGARGFKELAETLGLVPMADVGNFAAAIYDPNADTPRGMYSMEDVVAAGAKMLTGEPLASIRSPNLRERLEAVVASNHAFVASTEAESVEWRLREVYDGHTVEDCIGALVALAEPNAQDAARSIADRILATRPREEQKLSETGAWKAMRRDGGPLGAACCVIDHARQLKHATVTLAIEEIDALLSALRSIPAREEQKLSYVPTMDLAEEIAGVVWPDWVHADDKRDIAETVFRLSARAISIEGTTARLQGIVNALFGIPAGPTLEEVIDAIDAANGAASAILNVRKLYERSKKE